MKIEVYDERDLFANARLKKRWVPPFVYAFSPPGRARNGPRPYVFSETYKRTNRPALP